MSTPIINGLATYGIIRLYNTGKPILAFLFTLLFTIGPVGLLFWSLVLFKLFTPVFVIAGFFIGFFIVGGAVGATTENSFLGWVAAWIYAILVVGIVVAKYS